jgi:amino-acid N-acetyltransferase
MVRIQPALADDLAPLCALLAGAELPIAGLREHLGTALVARAGAEIVGCVALEVYGDAALLRSLAVAPSRRRSGLGRRLAQAALDLGSEVHVRSFCLLTTTAAEFFVRHFGFRPVVRDAVPAVVRGSVEFTSACPSSAQVMLLERR